MNIPSRVKQIMTVLDIGATEVANKGALPIESVRSILKGISKNPGAEMLKGLSKAFGCSIDFIVSSDEITLEALTQKNPATSTPAVSPINIELYQDAILAVEDAARSKNLDLAGNPVLRKYYVNQAYELAIERAGKEGVAPVIDQVFVSWIVGKDIKESQ